MIWEPIYKYKRGIYIKPIVSVWSEEQNSDIRSSEGQKSYRLGGQDKAADTGLIMTIGT